MDLQVELTPQSNPRTMIRAKKARQVIVDPDSGKKKYIYGPQKHRRAWERLPELKGWLRPSKKAEYYSYCSFCDKHLKANRRSLLDHAKSRVHLDSLPGGGNGAMTIRRPIMHNIPLPEDTIDPLLANEPINEDDDEDYDDSMQMGDGFIDDDNGSAFVMAQMGGDYGDEDNSNEIDTKDGIFIGDSEDEMDAKGFHPPPPPLVQMSVGDSFNGINSSFGGGQDHQLSRSGKIKMDKFPISTHILDTMHGSPANGVPVTLSRFHDEGWTVLGSGLTNQDGRYKEFITQNYFVPGRYKIHFYVEDYFKKLNVDFFYPFIEIVFDVRDSNQHFHVPLLLNAFGYTTYRGS